MAGSVVELSIMAIKLVYSWADKLWHMNPPRKYIATRWQQ